MEVAERRQTLTRSRSTRSRLLVALSAGVPLLTIFAWLCLVYGWEAWGNLAPWLISDEFERTQLSRAVATTGHEARRAVPHAFDTFYVYLIAPAWWIHDTTRAYGVVKAIGVVTMTSVVFPAYLFARMLVSKQWALFAAAGAAMIPALAYSSMVLVEPLAYPWAALCFYLLAKALVTRRPLWVTAAAAACLLAPRVRSELAVIAAAAVGSVLAFWFMGDGGRRLRRNWTSWDWTGFVVLSICAFAVLNAVAVHRSPVWELATQHHLGRTVRYGFWAAGALTIGVGVLPTIAGLSALVKARGEQLSREHRAFISIAMTMFVAFGIYTAAKSAYVSTLGLTYLTERNLIYVAPLLFVGTAVVLERRRPLTAAVVAATAFALYLVTTTPYEMHIYIFFDAPGLSVLESLGRTIGLTPSDAKILLIGLALASGALLAFARLFRRTTASLVLPLVAVFLLAWNAYGEITFARASHKYGNDILATLPRPLNWIDRTVPNGTEVYYLGQSLTDPNPVLQLEFWNRSVRHVWSTDGTAPGPGPTVTPSVVSRDGQLQPGDGVQYMVADSGIRLVGRVLATKFHWGGTPLRWALYRISPPLRLRQTEEGIYGDGWGRPKTALNQYSLPNGRQSSVRIRVSRARGGKPLPATVTVRVGQLALGSAPVLDQSVMQPIMGKVLFTRTLHVQRNLEHVFEFKAPKPPFRVETFVTPLPSAGNLAHDPNDRRALGAQVSYEVRPL
jgi:hypothetical protein